MNPKIKQILQLYEKYGAKDYIGEELTQTEHMVQASMIAIDNIKDIPQEFKNDFVLACFLHDIGHLLAFDTDNLEQMGEYGITNHEKLGADFLRSLGIRYPIPELVENHVQAKRYLVGKNPEYLQQLSGASKKTLTFQGGPMTQDEIKIFEKDPLFDMSLKIRDMDDKAKIKDKKILGLEFFEKLLDEHLESNI
tara:strand:- start:60 stop:641 length:582 start_codon:yes stop_codon:yes gene_type:complete